MQQSTEHVRYLKSTTLQQFIESTSVVLLSVVMLPISGRCRTFELEFKKIAYVMQVSGIAFAQINALESGEATASFNITTFPHLLLFKGVDNFKKYRGSLKETDIMAYLGRYLQFPVLSTITATSLTEFKNSSDAVVIGYIAAEDSSSKGQFELLASTMHPEYVFGISNDLTLAKLEQAYVPGLVVYIENDKERTALPLMDDLDEMVVNVRKAARPLIVDLVLEVHKNLLDMGIPFGYVFASSLEERVRLRKELKSLARKYRQNIQFGIADPVAVGSIVKDLHLDFSSLPAFAIREPVANLRYPMNKPTGIFSDALEGFVQDYLDGKLQPTIKSEPIPGKSEDGVVKVVGLTYQEIVMDETRDVLLIYCIASCGPCDALHPTLVALAKLFASSRNLEEKVTIAKIMYDANDTPERGIIGFPTIKLFPAASKSAPVTFFGDRTFDALANFIRDHGTHKGDLLDSEEN